MAICSTCLRVRLVPDLLDGDHRSSTPRPLGRPVIANYMLDFRNNLLQANSILDYTPDDPKYRAVTRKVSDETL